MMTASIIASIIVLILNLWCVLSDPVMYRGSTFNAVVVGMAISTILWLLEENE